VLIGRTLIEKEAKARGMTPEALDQAEVAAKALVTDADGKTAYANNRSRFPNVAEATALEQIRASLLQQRQTERRTAYTRELRARYDVRVLIEPFRVPVELAGAPVRGNPKATVTVIEFSDFQCPYCHRVRPTMTRLRELYADRVRFAFRHYPLDFHPQAQKAGEAAACAGEQGKFWEMHDRLWDNPSKLQVDDLKAHAETLGLGAAAFAACPDPGPFAAPGLPRLGALRRRGRGRPARRPGVRRLGNAGVLRQRPAARGCAAVRGVPAGDRGRARPHGGEDADRVAVTPRPAWLRWAERLQAIAQTGLTYAKDPYDLERY